MILENFLAYLTNALVVIVMTSMMLGIAFLVLLTATVYCIKIGKYLIFQCVIILNEPGKAYVHRVCSRYFKSYEKKETVSEQTE